MYTDLFTGIEAEGRFKGVKTLFIPNRVLVNPSLGYVQTTEIILEAAAKHSCHHLYFGASSDFIDKEEYGHIEHIIETMIKKEISIPVTIEVPISQFDDVPGSLLSWCHFIVRVTGSGSLSTALSNGSLDIEIKIEGPKQICILSNSRQSVGLDYLKDEAVK